jgi:uncharacterized protein DUF3309
MLATILIVIVILMLVGALPRWNHSRLGILPQRRPRNYLADCGRSDSLGQALIRERPSTPTT